MGLTGVTFSLVVWGVSLHYPVSSERAAGADCCLSPQRLSVLFYVCHTLARNKWKHAILQPLHRAIPRHECAMCSCLLNFLLSTSRPLSLTWIIWIVSSPSHFHSSLPDCNSFLIFPRHLVSRSCLFPSYASSLTLQAPPCPPRPLHLEEQACWWGLFLLILAHSGGPIRGFESWFWCQNLRVVS